MKKFSLLAVAMLIAADAYAGSCVVCPFGMKCTGGTAAPVDDATAAKADRERMGIPAFPDGVYARDSWYLGTVDPKDVYQHKHISIKAGTTIIVNGKVITFTSDTNKSLDIATAGTDYDICVSNAIDTSNSHEGAVVNSTGIKTVDHNTACGAGWLKIGGFHSMPCVPTGLSSVHPYYGIKEKAIMPNSVWTLKHHPVSIEGGFVYDPAMGHWVMIYLPTLSSTKSYYTDTLANGTTAISSTRYDPVLCKGQTGYCDGAGYPGTYVQANITTTDPTTTNINVAKKLVSRYNQRVATNMEFREMQDLLIGGGAKPLGDAQFSSAALGSIEGNAIGTRKYTAMCYNFSSISGGANDLTNISNIGAIGMTGEYLQDLDYAVDSASSWTTQAGTKGNSYGPAIRVLAGGYWAALTNTGSRSRIADTTDTVVHRNNAIAARGMSPDAWR